MARARADGKAGNELFIPAFPGSPDKKTKAAGNRLPPA